MAPCVLNYTSFKTKHTLKLIHVLINLSKIKTVLEDFFFLTSFGKLGKREC